MQIESSSYSPSREWSQPSIYIIYDTVSCNDYFNLVSSSVDVTTNQKRYVTWCLCVQQGAVYSIATRADLVMDLRE